MPKFIVTNSTGFQPFTYDELMKPILMQQEVHNATQDAYDKLSMETSALENYISKNEGDKRARQMYENYMSRLSQLQDDLWNNGINPNTRRDLSMARDTYASDINRIAKAIETRQARSKEYWDARHKDPSLIASEDPGLAGLDSYLDNDAYGQNYYSYSGEKFAAEVAADAKTRAEAMLNDPEISKDPKLAGYWAIKSSTGFSNQEINNAGSAIKDYLAGDEGALSKLDDAEKILADVFLNHLDKTGAKGKVSNEEFNRLVGYGLYGLSQATGKTTISYQNDKEWDLQASMLKEANKAAAKAAKSGSANGTSDYTFENTSTQRTTEGYKKLQDSIGHISAKYANGPITLMAPDGTSSVFHDEWEATNAIYNPESRRRARAELRGLDVAYIDRRQDITFTGSDGKTKKYHTAKMPASVAKNLGFEDGVVVMDENNNIISDWTARFNNYRKDYLNHVHAYQKNNPSYSMHRIAISPEMERDIRKDNDMMNITDTSDLRDILTTKNYRGNIPNGTLVGSQPAFDYARRNYGRLLIDSFMQAPKNSDGTIDKGSNYGFYRINNETGKAETEAERDITKVLGKKMDPDTILSITVQPMDLASKSRKMRMVTTSGTWEFDASMLGSRTEAAVDKAAKIQRVLMMPIKNPESILMLDDDTVKTLTDSIHGILSRYGSDPLMISEGGVARPATAKEIVRNRALQEVLLKVSTSILNKIFSVPRDIIYDEHQTRLGDTRKTGNQYDDEYEED